MAENILFHVKSNTLNVNNSFEGGCSVMCVCKVMPSDDNGLRIPIKLHNKTFKNEVPIYAT